MSVPYSADSSLIAYFPKMLVVRFAPPASVAQLLPRIDALIETVEAQARLQLAQWDGWDIRAEYRGIVIKAPSFGLQQYSTNRYYNISNPTIGVAYHF